VTSSVAHVVVAHPQKKSRSFCRHRFSTFQHNIIVFFSHNTSAAHIFKITLKLTTIYYFIMFKSLITIALVAGASAFAPVSFVSRSNTSLQNDKVIALIIEQLGVDADKVVPEATFIDDLGADSLDTVELIMAIEEEFDCEIPEDEAASISTVGEVIAFVDKL
jgi:acyl carrier protein